MTRTLPNVFNVGTLVVSTDDPKFPYEVRAVDVHVTQNDVSVLYSLLDPSCDKDAPLQCCRTLYAKDVEPYSKFKVGDRIQFKSYFGNWIGGTVTRARTADERYLVRLDNGYSVYFFEEELTPIDFVSPHCFQD